MQEWFEAPLPAEAELRNASDTTYSESSPLPSYERLLLQNQAYVEKVDAFLTRYEF